MSREHDVIVVGGGHNGLVCAARLARAGRRVLLCEQRGLLGGLIAAEPFHDGVSSIRELPRSTIATVTPWSGKACGSDTAAPRVSR